MDRREHEATGAARRVVPGVHRCAADALRVEVREEAIVDGRGAALDWPCHEDSWHHLPRREARSRLVDSGNQNEREQHLDCHSTGTA